MTHQHVPSTPAGWYPDPWGIGHLRYYDGSVWTEGVSELPKASDRFTKMALPVGRTPLSIVAGYVGLFSILIFPAPLSLILGIAALVQLRKQPGYLGAGRAIFAIVAGGLGTMVLFIILAVPFLVHT